jgi:hypothetical protein
MVEKIDREEVGAARYSIAEIIGHTGYPLRTYWDYASRPHTAEGAALFRPTSSVMVRLGEKRSIQLLNLLWTLWRRSFSLPRKKYATTNASGRSLGQWILLALSGALLIGCGSVSTRFVSGLSAEDRALAAELPVYRERLPEESYKLVGPVNGLSCQLTHDDQYRVSEENAIEELRRATFKAGANAVMGVRCDVLEQGQGTRSCFRSIECRGSAVQTTPASK